MKEPTLRGLKALSYLPKYPGGITVRELHHKLRNEGFEISIRTLQRDLNGLSVAFPIGDERRGRGSIWYWSSDAALFSIPSMDSYTALTFMLAEAHMAELFPANMGSDLKLYFDAAREVFKRSDLRHLSDWRRKIRVIPRNQSLMAACVRPHVSRAVHEALLRDKRLRVRYQAREEPQAGEREVNPLALAHRYGVSYLVCTFWEYTDLRHMALHRFHTAEVLDDAVVKPPGFDLDEFWRSGSFDYSRGDTIDLDVLFSAGAARHLYETPLSPEQSLCDYAGERVRLRANIEDTLQLRWWLMGFGENAQVIGPQSLREAFARTAQCLSEFYATG